MNLPERCPICDAYLFNNEFRTEPTCCWCEFLFEVKEEEEQQDRPYPFLD